MQYPWIYLPESYIRLYFYAIFLKENQKDFSKPRIAVPNPHCSLPAYPPALATRMQKK